VSQLAIPNKRPRFGPKVCTKDWWLGRIKGSDSPKYNRYCTHYTNYQIGQFKAVAEFDFEVLGERIGTQGAPDSQLAREYPIKLAEKPFWQTWSFLSYKEFRLWTWIQGTKAVDLPISEQAEIWFNYFSIESNQVKAKELLDPLRKENQKEFDPLLEEEYNLVYPTTSLISSIEFSTPTGDPFSNLDINSTLQDSRYIPITESGEVIRKRFIKHYLEQRLVEYLALGGLKELVDRKPLIQAGQKLPDPFYWDLWGNLEHLRESYSEYLAEQIFGPDSEEESVVSLDTQA
jgi:hypothetical protein